MSDLLFQLGNVKKLFFYSFVFYEIIVKISIKNEDQLETMNELEDLNF